MLKISPMIHQNLYNLFRIPKRSNNEWSPASFIICIYIRSILQKQQKALFPHIPAG